MKCIKSIFKKKEQVEEVTDEEWAENLKALYENELSDNEEAWEVEKEGDENIARFIK